MVRWGLHSDESDQVWDAFGFGAAERLGGVAGRRAAAGGRRGRAAWRNRKTMLWKPLALRFGKSVLESGSFSKKSTVSPYFL